MISDENEIILSTNTYTRFFSHVLLILILINVQKYHWSYNLENIQLFF